MCAESRTNSSYTASCAVDLYCLDRVASKPHFDQGHNEEAFKKMEAGIESNPDYQILDRADDSLN